MTRHSLDGLRRSHWQIHLVFCGRVYARECLVWNQSDDFNVELSHVPSDDSKEKYGSNIERIGIMNRFSMDS